MLAYEHTPSTRAPSFARQYIFPSNRFFDRAIMDDTVPNPLVPASSEPPDVASESASLPEDMSLGLTKAGKPRKRRAKSASPPERTDAVVISESATNCPEIPTIPVKGKSQKRKSTVPFAKGELNAVGSENGWLTVACSLATEVEPPTTPLAIEVLDNLARYPHCILLTRVGQFYEVCLLPCTA